MTTKLVNLGRPLTWGPWAFISSFYFFNMINESLHSTLFNITQKMSERGYLGEAVLTIF